MPNNTTQYHSAEGEKRHYFSSYARSALSPHCQVKY